jgi:endonuclease/exonuclease/phosphatase family metal-dependent hydrolase
MNYRKRKKSGIQLFSKIMLSMNLFAVVALFFSYLAAYINPEKLWVFSFFGLAYPAILIVNVLFIVYWLFQLPKFALISGLSLLMGIGIIQNHIGFRESTAIMVPKSSESFLRIMTYNVHNFKPFGDKNDLVTKESILDIIRKEQPDIICFQEFFTREKGDYNFRKILLEVLETEHYYFKTSANNGYEAIGMAIFSKFPILDKGNIQFAKNMKWNEAIYVDIKRGEHKLRVYNVHFQSISFKAEDYKYLSEVKNKLETNVESPRKIGSRLKKAFIKRASQARILKEHANESPIPYIIAGDFNDTPISYTVNTISKNMNNGFREMGSGFGITYNGAFPNFQIDYIFASQEFKIKNYLIIKKKLSDHYPVRADIELK